MAALPGGHFVLPALVADHPGKIRIDSAQKAKKTDSLKQFC